MISEVASVCSKQSCFPFGNSFVKTIKNEFNAYHVMISILFVFCTILTIKINRLRNELHVLKTANNESDYDNVYTSYIKEYIFLDVMQTLKGLPLDEIYSFMNKNITSLKKAKKFLSEFKKNYYY